MMSCWYLNLEMLGRVQERERGVPTPRDCHRHNSRQRKHTRARTPARPHTHTHPSPLHREGSPCGRRPLAISRHRGSRSDVGGWEEGISGRCPRPQSALRCGIAMAPSQRWAGSGSVGGGGDREGSVVRRSGSESKCRAGTVWHVSSLLVSGHWKAQEVPPAIRRSNSWIHFWCSSLRRSSGSPPKHPPCDIRNQITQKKPLARPSLSLSLTAPGG